MMGLPREIIGAAVASQTDMTLVPESMQQDEPLSVAQRTDADVIVFLVNQFEAGGASALVHAAFPSRAVLAVLSDGRHAWLYDYALHESADVTADLLFPEELSPPAVLDAIRRGASRSD
jgi:hypothetical protein